jgi:hypothetical protein
VKDSHDVLYDQVRWARIVIPVSKKRNTETAVFLEGLRESLLALNSAMVGIADTYRVDLSPEGEPEDSESETAAE